MTQTAKQATPKTPAPLPFSVIPLAGDIEDLPEPNGAPYFVMTKKGPMVHKNLLFARVLVPVKDVPTLAALPDNAKGYLWDNDGPKFPWELLNQAWAFFRWAWDERKAEAEVDIVWDPTGRDARTARQGFDDQGFRLFVPPQTAQGGGVKIARNEAHYRGDLVGTIHSHCNGGAYHSGTDTHDAEGHDGLHMTIGRVSANKPEIDVMIASNSVLWNKLKLSDYTLGDKDDWRKEIDYPEWWNNFHNHPEAVELFRGQQFASGSRPTTAPSTPREPTSSGTTYYGHPSGGSQSGWHGQRNGNHMSPYSNFRIDEAEQFMRLVLNGRHLPEDISPRLWSIDADRAFDAIADALTDLKALGIKSTTSFYFQKSAIEPEFLQEGDLGADVAGRMLGLWDEEEMDADTRLAIAAMVDDGEVKLVKTETGIMVIAQGPAAGVYTQEDEATGYDLKKGTKDKKKKPSKKNNKRERKSN